MPIILDGENAWEYYPKSGREFLRRFYDGLQKSLGLRPSRSPKPLPGIETSAR